MRECAQHTAGVNPAHPETSGSFAIIVAADARLVRVPVDPPRGDGNSVFVEYIPQMEPLLKRPLQRRDGYGIPSDAAGHGIEFDGDALERFTVRQAVLSRTTRAEAVGAVSHTSLEPGQ